MATKSGSSGSSSSSGNSGSNQFRMTDGDWVCDDPICANINFARRLNCNLCGKDKPFDKNSFDKNKRKVGHEIGKVAADKSKGLFSADDWQCARCGNVNWARRHQCNMCNAPKFGENEERTGLGGGYNEREENVEYIEREESDSEYDDFGRRRKKKLKTSRSDNNDDSNASTNSDKEFDNNQKNSHKSDKNSNNNKNDSHIGKYHNNSEKQKKEEEEEEEDDEEGDVSKYKLDSDDEDDDDEDDEDLSKYDLSDFSKD